MNKSLQIAIFIVLGLGITPSLAQKQEYLDVLKIEATVMPITALRTLTVDYNVIFKVNKKVDSVFLDMVNIAIDSSFVIKGTRIEPTDKKLWLHNDFIPQQEYSVGFKYAVKPAQTVYFTGNQVWTQGQGKYTSHWLPSLDDMNDKIEFDLTVIAPKEKTVIANGQLKVKIPNEDLIEWHFDMEKPMSSYLVAFALGDFVQQTINSASGIPLEMYVSKRDSAKLEPTYRHTKEIFDFFESKIGVAYPWQNYKQVPVRDFLYAGMENTTATIFSESFVCDATGYKDQNYVNVNAHELAHQWFGNLVTEVASNDHWLHEGFATYFALRAEREIFGEDYYYWKLYQSAERLKSLSEEGKGEALTNPKASSLTFYEKGAWALHILEEQLGTLLFDRTIAAYLNRYAYKNVTVDNFLIMVEMVTGRLMDTFKKDWLEQTSFNSTAALESLSKSTFMQEYFEAQALRALPLSQKKEQLFKLLAQGNDYIGQEVVIQLAEEPIGQTLALYQAAFETDNLYIRQAIAQSFKDVPVALQTEYESLLDDASYVTQEAAFYNLWNSFPTSAIKYLEKLKQTVGFQSKNIRQLWLVLAIMTDGYDNQNKRKYLDELVNYTTENYSFEVRQIALRYLIDIQVYSAIVLKSLVNATVHHNWRFRSFARNRLKKLLENSEIRETLNSIRGSFDQKAQDYLGTIL
ncbi:MAG: M1 family metallopeptidase [Gilvibacter sp.]